MIDQTVVQDQEYWYWVVAKNAFGSSAASLDDDGYSSQWPTPPAGVDPGPLNTLAANTLVVDGSGNSELLDGIKVV